MRRMLLTMLFGFGLTAAIAAAPAEDAKPEFTAEQRQFFTMRIRPLLKSKCLGCHGDGETVESKYDMRSRDGLIRGGEIGAGAVPGKSKESPIFQAVLRDGDLVMPPKDRNRLDVLEIDALRRWVDMGLPWDDAGAAPTADAWDDKDGVYVKTSGGLDPTWTNRRYKPEDIWAYQPLKKVEVPDVEQVSRRVRQEKDVDSDSNKSGDLFHGHPIDAFIARKLKQQKLEPAPPADARTWLRRATFDLTGLPPTPEELADSKARLSDSAMTEALDRLLASPHYGERMAQHWLDVVRYADTGGFANDWERPHAWRYRDWVIRSFNDDKPYNRFVIEQLAGDELDSDDPEMKIAVGFLRMGPWEQTAMSVAAITRQQFLDDVTNSVGLTFLGQGMSCCQCHDHKFDPLPTRDFYRLQAVFASTTFDEPETPFITEENKTDFDRRVKEVALLAEADDWMKVDGEILDSASRVRKKREKYMVLAKERFAPKSYSVRVGGGQKVNILAGGSLERAGEEVSPGVLSAVRFGGDSAGRSPDLPHDGGRLELAQWIADERNPLTSRVIVNRVWQMHFGTGLVATPSNFGKMGARPSHPELLDWLAGWFLDNGWSIKKLHRLIMTSETYRRSSRHSNMEQIAEIDPKNQLLSYFPPRRMTAEEIRDAMLSITGELNRELGGPGVFPQINWEVAMQPRHIMGSIAPAYQPSPRKKDRDRRTIYAFRIRTLANPLLEVHNRPSPDISCERRDETTVTPQVFALFNSENVHTRALALAKRLEGMSDDVDGQIRAAYGLVYGRSPSNAELAACRAHVETMTVHHRENPPAQRELPTVVDREMIDEQTGKPFRWQEKLHWLLDYERDLMPWDATPQTRGLAELCLVLLNSNEFVYVY